MTGWRSVDPVCQGVKSNTRVKQPGRLDTALNKNLLVSFSAGVEVQTTGGYCDWKRDGAV